MLGVMVCRCDLHGHATDRISLLMYRRRARRFGGPLFSLRAPYPDDFSEDAQRYLFGCASADVDTCRICDRAECVWRRTASDERFPDLRKPLAAGDNP
jgi:hypothetical protein